MPVPALLGAAAISAGGGLIGGFLNRQSSMEAMDYQAELNQRAIDRQNAYNHPLAQRQRYEEAGLNPYLAMTDAGNQSASAQTSLAQPDVGTPISQAAQSIGNAVMQYPQLKADVENKQANTDYINEQQRGVKIENDFKSLRIQGELEQLKAQTDKLVEEGKLTKKQGQLLIDTYEDQKRSYALQNDSTEATIANTKADTTNKEHETKKIDAETELLKAKKVTETTVQLLNRANAAKSDAEKRQIEAIIPKLGEYYDSMIYHNKSDTWQTVAGRLLEKGVEFLSRPSIWKKSADWIAEQWKNDLIINGFKKGSVEVEESVKVAVSFFKDLAERFKENALNAPIEFGK